ncbi:hypothetical protein D3C77_550840 [compost metagenome]
MIKVLVGALEDRLRGRCFSASAGNPDGNGQCPGRGYLGRGNGLADALGNVTGCLQVGFRQYQRKLLAACPAGQIVLPGALRNDRCHLLEGFVADIMAEGVVDPLEMIDIQSQHCVLALRQGQSLQRRRHGAAIGQAGQGVALGLMAEVAELLLQ